MKNGHVVLDVPTALPEGTRVEVSPINESRPTFGMRDEDWPTTPEGIRELLARMDALEPLEFTPEEESEIEAARAAVREATLTKMKNSVPCW
jgi:hypothetical protein